MSEDASRLDEAPTRWSLMGAAHRNSLGAGAARNALALRYAKAIRNFAGSLVKGSHDAEEVSQEVVQRLLRGQFAGAGRAARSRAT